MNLVRKLAQLLLFPVRRVLDPRFHDVTHRLSQARQEIGVLDAHVTGVVEQVDGAVKGAVASQVEATALLGQELRAVSGEMARLEEHVGHLREDMMRFSLDEHQRSYEERMARLTGDGRLDHLDQPAADLINYALSHRGFAAQAHLWTNPPLALEHARGGVRLGSVNERIVEVPFAMRALGGVPLGGRVLDFGSSESQVALSLASMGYRVTALDLSTYPFEHPGIDVVTSPLEAWDAPEDSFDAALCVSTVEHVGLGWYGEQAGMFDDVRAMGRLRELVKPGGTIVLTVPYGKAGVDAVQRRYDRAGLDGLLEGLDVVERVVVEKTGERTWTPVEESTGHAVALVSARVPAA